MDVPELLDFDREHLWHPYTSVTNPTPVRLITDAAGARLQVTEAGSGAEASQRRWLVDGMASWWAAIHGYCHPALDEAIRGQTNRFSHVMFGGLTHAPAIELAQRLVALTPEPLQRVFLADSGSVSVEVALKMVLQYQRGSGRSERTRMLTVLGGYHGDTFDCMSVTDPIGGMHAMWAGLLPEQVFAPRPPGQAATGEQIDRWADGVRELAAAHAHELAGIIIEPLLQGAGGMWPFNARCLEVLREIADEHELLLVFDEIATGFGRTGHLFASELTPPDIVCLGKALTGGYLSMAAVLTTDKVARGISASDSGVLMHGPTFMGNPLACAVASASIDVLCEQDWKANIARINASLSAALEPLRDRVQVADVRTIGAVGVVQLRDPVDVPVATDAAIAAGVWLRPFGNLIYAMPPYVISDSELRQLGAGITAAVDAS